MPLHHRVLLAGTAVTILLALVIPQLPRGSVRVGMDRELFWIPVCCSALATAVGVVVTRPRAGGT